MKKFLLSSFVMGVFGLYSLRVHANSITESLPVQPIINSRFGDDDERPRKISTPISSSTTAPLAINTKYKDGEYTGNVTDAYYGLVQVRAKISGGKISDVIFLQYPNDRRTSIEINTQAMPLLKQEAVQTQSAKVAGVSGATQTSQAFIQSLQSALDKAV